MCWAGLIQDRVVIRSKRECPSLQSSRCQRGDALGFLEQVLEGLVVRQNCEMPACKKLVEAFHTKDDGQTFFVQLRITFLRRSQSSRGLSNRAFGAVWERV